MSCVLASCRARVADGQCPDGPRVPLATDTLRIVVGSGLRDGALRGGRVPPCGEDFEATAAFAAARAALAMVPAPLRPRAMSVHIDPKMPRGHAPLGPIEMHQASGALMVASGAAASLGPAPWVHEIAHVRMSGPRPAGPTSARLIEALEEGVADYFAATLLGTPRLGSARDLNAPPTVRAGEWEALVLPGLVPDSHRLGSVLAADLWAERDRDAPAIEDLVACFANPAPFAPVRDVPDAALATFVARCPEVARPGVRGALARWAPAEIAPGLHASPTPAAP
jgi:hypothetical protein